MARYAILTTREDGCYSLTATLQKPDEECAGARRSDWQASEGAERTGEGIPGGPPEGDPARPANGGPARELGVPLRPRPAAVREGTHRPASEAAQGTVARRSQHPAARTPRAALARPPPHR